MSLTRKDAKNETRTMWRSLDPVLLLVSWGAFGVRYPRRLRSRHNLAGLVAATPYAVKLKIFLIWRILPVASISRDRFGVLIPVGVATIFLFHVFVHV